MYLIPFSRESAKPHYSWIATPHQRKDDNKISPKLYYVSTSLMSILITL